MSEWKKLPNGTWDLVLSKGSQALVFSSAEWTAFCHAQAESVRKQSTSIEVAKQEAETWLREQHNMPPLPISGIIGRLS